MLFERDIHMVWLPRVETMVRAVAQGSWPVWDPHVAFGLPALSDPSYQIAYPPTWLNLLLPAATYYKTYALGHCVFAGLGLFLLLRRWGLADGPAFLGGAAWCASGVLLSFVSLHHHLAGLAWIPWVLFALHRAVEEPAGRAAAGLGLAVGAQVLAGSGDMCLVTALLALPYAALVLRGRDREVPLRRVLFSLGTAAAIAVLVPAVQWLPTARDLPTGARPRHAAQTYWSVHPLTLLDVVAPRAVEGLPLRAEWRSVLFEGREPFLASLYLGAPVLVLAALGAVLRGPPLRGLALAAAPAFLFVALGRHVPLAPLFFQVPPASLMRYPAKLMIGAALAVAVLAALGAAGWGREWSVVERRRTLLVALVSGGAGLSLLAAALVVRVRPEVLADLAEPGADLRPLVGRLGSSAVAAVAAAILVLLRWRGRAGAGTGVAIGALTLMDLVRAGRGVNDLAPAALLEHRPPVLRHVAADGRLYAAPASPRWLAGQLTRGPAGWEPGWRWALGLQEALTAPSAARWGIDGSFDGDLTGLAPPVLGQWTYALLQAPDPLARAILRMGNVGTVVHVTDSAYRGLGTEAELPSVYTVPIRVSRVPDPVPRAYVVGEWRDLPDDAAPTALLSPGFDLRRAVVLAAGQGSRAAPPGFHGRARILARRADRLLVEAEASHGGLLVLVEGYHVGWRATVDGQAAPVLRANTLFRAVPIPKGSHEVDLRFRPPGAATGGVLTLLGALGALTAAVRRGKRQKMSR